MERVRRPRRSQSRRVQHQQPGHHRPDRRQPQSLQERRHRPSDARRIHDDDPVQGSQDQVPGQEMSVRPFALLMLFAAAGAAAGCADCCCCAPEKSAAAAETKQAPPAPGKDEGKSLFDGKTLGSWKSVDFGGEGAVKIEKGSIRVEMGATVSGIQWTGEAPPRTDYEFTVEAMKVDGSDFFLCIVFPVGKDTCSFVAGGWGGGVTGLSSVDHMNASENETASDQT